MIILGTRRKKNDEKEEQSMIESHKEMEELRRTRARSVPANKKTEPRDFSHGWKHKKKKEKSEEHENARTHAYIPREKHARTWTRT